MDPLTAFSLACGVIQVVDFSTKVLTKCKEIYNNGALSEYDDIEKMSNHLADLRKDLRLPSSRKIEIPSDKDLLDMATKCSATAAQLVTKLQALRIDGPHKKRDALKKTVQYFWEKKDTQDIQKRLDSYRSALDTHILINLRSATFLISQRYLADWIGRDISWVLTCFPWADSVMTWPLYNRPKGFKI